MQWYASGPNDLWVGKNDTLPDESDCVLCYDPYDIWERYEYAFQFSK